MWQIGNTTVRSALRLREGLIALEKSGKQGSIRGEEGEKNFRNLLSEYKVVEIGEDETFSAGRKWRSAMEKMGFLYPKLTGKDKFLQDQVGIPDHITPNGKSLIKAKSLSGWHECHLRAMIAYFIDYEDLIKLNNKKKRLSIINSNQPRYPFIYILKILTYLNDFEGDSKISMIEMGLIIQCSDPKTNIEEIVSEIKDYRKKREAASSKKKFDDEFINRKAQEIGLGDQTIAADYPDTTFRYLKATGIISSRGKKGIAIVPEELSNIRDIIESEIIPINSKTKFEKSCLGASLPNDSIEKAGSNLIYYRNLLADKGEKLDISKLDTKNIKETSIAIRDIKDRLFNLKEKEFANDQKNKTEEISKYIEMLIGRKKNVTLKGRLSDGTEILIPKGQHPAYFEWTIWRSFLSLDSLYNEPWDARRFDIDQEFFPLNHAPGGGADVIIELEDIILIIEVTFTSSSRQEAAEGEPVRRHVADALEKNKILNKKVYGLFIALNIDTNTANTFRLGEWYTKDDVKLELDIVPLTLNEFKLIFDAVIDNPSRMLLYFEEFLENCRADSKLEAPKWKKKITHNCNSLAEKLSSHNAILA